LDPFILESNHWNDKVFYDALQDEILLGYPFRARIWAEFIQIIAIVFVALTRYCGRKRAFNIFASISIIKSKTWSIA